MLRNDQVAGSTVAESLETVDRLLDKRGILENIKELFRMARLA